MRKGQVSAVKDRFAVVVPQGEGKQATCPLAVPERIRDKLEPGTWVVYATFPDCTGIVLETMDG